MSTTSEVQTLYIGLLGRAADPDGLAYWVGEIDAGTLTLEQLRSNIVNEQAEYLNGLGTYTRSQLVNALYENMFDRGAGTEGLDYWVDGGGSTVPAESLVLALDNAAKGTDRLTLDNKVTAATYYTANTLQAAYTKALATASVSDVDSTEASVTASKAATDDGGAGDGTTYTLTTGIDTFTGTALNDAFNGITGTFTTLDSLDGGAGADTLSVAQTGDYATPTGSSVTNIETVAISSTGTIAALDTTGYTGLTALVATGVGGVNVTAAATTGITAVNTGAQAMAIIGGGLTGSFTTGDAAVTVGATAIVNAYTSVSVIGGSTVAISDNATTAQADGTTLTTVSLKGNTDAATLNTDGLTTLNLVNNTQNVTVNAIAGTRVLTINESVTTTTSTLADALATTVNLNHTGATASVGITLNAAAATTVTIDSQGTAPTTGSALTIADVNIAAATTLNFTGDTAITLTATTTVTALTDYVSTNTAGVTITAAIAAADRFTGGDGADVVSFAATGTTANTLGAGNDTATFAGVAGTGGSVDAGAGTSDTVSLTHALAASLSAAALFEADISNFEVLSVAALAATTNSSAVAVAIDLDNLDDINSVVYAGAGTQTTSANTTTISNFSSGGSFEQTALLGALGNVVLTGDFTGASDSFTLKATATNGFANVGSVTLGSIESLSIVLDDSNTAAATTMFDLNLDATAATSVTVTGDAGITFANSSLTAIRTLDAAGVTATGAAGVVTFTANDFNSNITTAGGNDVIVLGNATNTVTLGEGTDTVTAGTGVDTIILTETTAVTDTVITASYTSVDSITGFIAGGGGDNLDLTLTGVEAIGTTADWVDGDASSAAVAAVSVQNVTAAATMAAATTAYAITGTYAATTDVETALEIGGSRALTTGGTWEASDASVVIYSDGTDAYLALFESTAGAASTTFAAADLVVTNLVTLAGVTDVSGYTAANFDII